MSKEHGYIILTTENGEQQRPTSQCPHCGYHFNIVRGSGHKRSFCMRCMKPVCDKEQCIKECIPLEMRLDLIEKGKAKEIGNNLIIL